jgi:transcriptional regulator with XRE-family HTH domain
VIGERIRELRVEQELSVSELARRAGVSKSLVSQVEHNRTNPSVETVQAIAQALEVPLFSLFLEEDGPQSSLVRAQERLRLTVPGSEAVRELLTPDLDRDMILLYSRIGPGSKSSRRHASHAGEECVYVLRGRLTVAVHDEVSVLEPGDSFYFDARLPHLFWNDSEEEDAEFIAAMSSRSLPLM